MPDEDIAGLLIQLSGTGQSAARGAIIRTLYELGAYKVIAELPPELFPLETGTVLLILSSWVSTGKYHAFRKTAAKLRAQPLQLSPGELDTETMRQLWLLEAVCTWELGEKLQQEKWLQSPAELRSGLLFIDTQLSSEAVLPQAAVADSGHSPLITEVIRLAVKLELVTLGKLLVDRFPAHTGDLAEVLYEEGWRAEAGNCSSVWSAAKKRGDRRCGISERCWRIKGIMPKQRTGTGFRSKNLPGMRQPVPDWRYVICIWRSWGSGKLQTASRGEGPRASSGGSDHDCPFHRGAEPHALAHDLELQTAAERSRPKLMKKHRANR